MVGTHRKFLQRILPFVVFGALWYLLIKHLSVYWAVDAQYSFGWFGPVICAFYSLDHSAPDWTRALTRRGMGFPDCLFGISIALPA